MIEPDVSKPLSERAPFRGVGCIELQEKMSLFSVECRGRFPVQKCNHCREMHCNIAASIQRSSEKRIDNFVRMKGFNLCQHMSEASEEIGSLQSFDQENAPIAIRDNGEIASNSASPKSA